MESLNNCISERQQHASRNTVLDGGKSVLIGGVPGKSRATVWDRRGANSRQVGAGQSPDGSVLTTWAPVGEVLSNCLSHNSLAKG